MGTRQNILLTALQRKSTALPKDNPAATVNNSQTPASNSQAEKPQIRSRRIGKPVQFWLHTEDRVIVRELSAWLAGQGIRPTDSMVVRAALRMAKPGGALLDAYKQSALLDGRLRPVGSPGDSDRA